MTKHVAITVINGQKCVFDCYVDEVENQLYLLQLRLAQKYENKLVKLEKGQRRFVLKDRTIYFTHDEIDKEKLSWLDI